MKTAQKRLLGESVKRRWIIVRTLVTALSLTLTAGCTDSKKAQAEKLSQILKRDRDLSQVAAGNINPADRRGVKIMRDNREDRLGLLHEAQGMKKIEGDRLEEIIAFLKAENDYCDAVGMGIAAYDQAYSVSQSRGGLVAHNGYFDAGDRFMRQARLLRRRLSESEVILKELGWEPVWAATS